MGEELRVGDGISGTGSLILDEFGDMSSSILKYSDIPRHNIQIHNHLYHLPCLLGHGSHILVDRPPIGLVVVPIPVELLNLGFGDQCHPFQHIVVL